ncbi:PPC domain-containing protein [Azospirillum doebereinerae]|uniref:PPC domain-containing protein n=1 Tax=Azospirillum doebereinerae TaxID=92933 RepID=UPI001EE5EC00|nr:PPC domain-containing protein [Azospirillum doebereinerae]MCG5240166.1 PPC domain-containing protein [Azospirillum doebereinerae]
MTSTPNSDLTANGFDPLRYLASNTDLADAFGTDTQAAARHYTDHGIAEGRSGTAFSPFQYLASNSDLTAAFSTDAAAAEQHWIRYGRFEGRSQSGFDATGYLTSNPDLLAALGPDQEEAARHWLNFGQSEGRCTNLFDAAAYLAANPDLAAAFGTNASAASQHYITYGYREGRKFSIDSRESSKDDFADNTATTGRLTIGGTASGVTEKAFDKDWFAVTLEKGATYRFSVDTYASIPWLRLYDMEGQRVPTGSYQPSVLTFGSTPQVTVETTGVYYLEYDSTPSSGPGKANGLGPYTVRAERVATNLDFSDDYGNSAGTAGRTTMNSTITGSIEKKGDEDYIAILLQQGRNYTFDVTPTSSDFYFMLRSSFDQLAWLGLPEKSNGHLIYNYTAGTTSTFYMDVTSYDIGSYAIRATDNGMVDDIAGNAGTTASLAIGGSAKGHIDYRPLSGGDEDSDWFAVSLQAGKSYDFDLQREGAGAGLLLKDAQGKTVSGTTTLDFLNYTTGQDSLRYRPTQSGTYYLTVNALMGGSGTDLAGYTVSARLSQGSAMLAAGGW